MSQAGANNVVAAPGVVDFLEGNTGGPVGPNGSNIIFVVGSGSISVTGNPGTNTLTIADSGLTGWQTIAADQTLVVNMGYFCTGGGNLTLTLPATSLVGDTISVSLQGSTGFKIAQSAGQSIRIGNLSTTAGVGGVLQSTQQGDTITMVCMVANLTWVIINSMGNPVLM